MFVPKKTIKNKKFNYRQNKILVRKTTQYGGDGVMFLLTKIIKNKKWNYPRKKNVGLARGFKTMCNAS